MTDSTDRLDEELAQRFARLRAAEGSIAPAFPTEQPAPAPARLRISAPAIAASLVAALLIAVVVLPPQPGPEAIYRDVIAASPLLGDELLQMTPDVLPEMSGVPQFVDGQVADDAAWEWLN